MLAKLVARVRNRFRREGIEREVEDELRFHVEMEAEAHRSRGLTPADARRTALRDLGGLSETRAAVHDVRAGRWRALVADAWLDARHTIRIFRRSPGFTTVAVVVLALGIGINTALFSIVNALFFRTLSVARPDQLVYLAENFSNGDMWAVMSALDQDVLRGNGAALMDFTSHWAVSQAITANNETAVASGEWVEHNYFDLLGVKPILGRGLEPSDDDPATTELAVVISYDLWARRFDADPRVVGRRVRVGDRQAVVVGVMPRGFSGLSDVWTPTEFWAGLHGFEGFGSPRRYADGPIGRLKPGVTFEQIQAFVAVQTRQLRQLHIDRLVASAGDQRFLEYERRWHLEAYRAVDVDIPRRPDTKLIPTALLAAVTTIVLSVLMIATSNITGLLLARGVTRTGELAVRRALGAGASRIVRQLLTECALLAVVGGVLGLIVSANLVTLFQKFSPSRYYVDIALDWHVFAFAAIACLGTGLLVGLAPAVQAVRINVLAALGHGVAGARPLRARLRYGVLIPQVALSLLLLIVAGVHVRSLAGLESKGLGYRPDNALVLTVNRWEPRIRADLRIRMTADERRRGDEEEAAKYRTFTRALLAKLQSLDHIGPFGLADSLPLGSSSDEPKILMPDNDAGGQPITAAARDSAVSDGYFAAMGMTMRQGRTFDGRDALDGVKAAVINTSLARRLWPQGAALGHSVAFVPQGAVKPEWLQIVGVVNDVEPVLHDGHDEAHVYVSLLQQWRPWARNVVIRTAGEPSNEDIQTIRREIVDADAFSEVQRVQTMQRMIDDLRYPRRVAAAILLGAGLIALTLACIGLYGVVSYSVGQRVREIGIRATLGAAPGDLVGLVVREGVVVVAVGTGVGLALSFAALRLTAGLVPGVPLVDAASIFVSPLVVGLVVLLACALPATRAVRVDPIRALREG